MEAALDTYRSLRREALVSAFLARQKAVIPRRETPRTHLVLPITLHLGEWETDTQTIELSAGGCSFMSSREPADSHFLVSLEVQKGIFLKTQARIVACVPQGDRFYICVAFSALSPAQKEALEELVVAALLSRE